MFTKALINSRSKLYIIVTTKFIVYIGLLTYKISPLPIIGLKSEGFLADKVIEIVIDIGGYLKKTLVYIVLSLPKGIELILSIL